MHYFLALVSDLLYFLVHRAGYNSCDLGQCSCALLHAPWAALALESRWQAVPVFNSYSGQSQGFCSLARSNFED